MLTLGILGGCGARAEEVTSNTETEVITISHNAGETKVTKKPKTVVASKPVKTFLFRMFND